MPIFGWDGLKKRSARPQTTGQDAGTGPATKCKGCGELLIKKTLADNFQVCPQCGHHHEIGARERIAFTLDEGSFVELDSDLSSKDVLGFRAAKSYEQTLCKAIEGTGLLSAMLTGHGTIHGHSLAVGVTDSSFTRGSMGSVLGEKFVRLSEYAIRERVPMLVFSGSGGGARMQEGVFSLMQMAKTSSAVAALHEAGLAYVVVCTGMTMGGVWASWAGLGDIIVAEPNCLIGFTGPRVIQETIRQDLPEGFQTSQFALEHGQVDMVVPRQDMRDTLGSVLGLVSPGRDLAESSTH